MAVPERVAALLQVFVWEDADEDVVTIYKVYESHQEDIQSMAAYPRRQLLATGADGLAGVLECWCAARLNILKQENCKHSAEGVL
jgi:hypothetical protein